jgi:hypothetical protein
MFKSASKSASNLVGIGNESNIDKSLQDKLSKIDDFFKQLDEIQIDARPTIDKEVSELGGLTGYHMRALINAISACNSTMKMRAFEIPTTCGDGCKERAKIIREALRTLLKYSERSDALGYIGAGRATVNSAGYLANSTASGLSKIGSNASYAANSLASGISKIGSTIFPVTPNSVPSESQPPEPQQMPPQPTPETQQMIPQPTPEPQQMIPQPTPETQQMIPQPTPETQQMIPQPTPEPQQMTSPVKGGRRRTRRRTRRRR